MPELWVNNHRILVRLLFAYYHRNIHFSVHRSSLLRKVALSCACCFLFPCVMRCCGLQTDAALETKPFADCSSCHLNISTLRASSFCSCFVTTSLPIVDHMLTVLFLLIISLKTILYSTCKQNKQYSH